MIGQLSKYRAIYKDTLRDPYEGARITTVGTRIRLSEFHKDNIVRQNPFFRGKHPSQIFTKNSIFESNFDSYIYCFSYNNSLTVLKSFDDADPYDRVAKITDLTKLGEIITMLHPQLKGWGWGFAPVFYKERIRTYMDPSDDYTTNIFEKPLLFSENLEGRFVFFRRKALRGIILHFPHGHQMQSKHCSKLTNCRGHDAALAQVLATDHRAIKRTSASKSSCSLN